MKKEDVHKISRRVDDPCPKNPLLVKLKLLYIRLVHNLGRDNCTYKNLKEKKKGYNKAQNTGHFKKKKEKEKKK